MIWFGADYHLGHKLLAKVRASTGFLLISTEDEERRVELMNEWIVEQHNRCVKPGDDFYFLGDLALANPRDVIKYVERMNGNWHVIRGNHNSCMEAIHKLRPFVWVKDRYMVRTQIGDEKIQIVLDHYPIESWKNRQHGAVHLHGHTHGDLVRNDPRRMDVGIDVQRRPVNLIDVYQRLVKGRLIKVDGHRPGEN